MLTTLSALVAVLSVGSPTPHAAAGCVRNHSEMAGFMMLVRWNVARKPAGVWHGLAFTASDSFTVRAVESDSLCDLANQTLRNYLPANMMPSRILLVSVGKYYVAEWAPDGPTHSEFRPQYFFDSTLTKVLFPCKDGYADC